MSRKLAGSHTRRGLRVTAMVAVALFGATLAACSLAIGWDDLRGGCRGACTEGDAASSTKTDAGGSDDSGDASSTATTLCGAAHDLCDDFDDLDGGPFPNAERWTTLEKIGGGTGMLATDDARSKPGSFRARAGGSLDSWGKLVKSFSGLVTGVTCEFDVKTEAGDSASNILLYFELSVVPKTGSALSDYVVQLGSSPDDPALQEYWRPTGQNSEGSEYRTVLKPNADVWQRIRFELVVASSSVRLFTNGGLLGSVTLAKFPAQHDGIALAFGARSDRDHAGGTVTLDDIACDIAR